MDAQPVLTGEEMRSDEEIRSLIALSGTGPDAQDIIRRTLRQKRSQCGVDLCGIKVLRGLKKGSFDDFRALT